MPSPPLLEGSLRVRRMQPGVNGGGGDAVVFGRLTTSTRWGTRLFTLSESHLTVSAFAATSSSSAAAAAAPPTAVEVLDLDRLAKVRWPTEQEAASRGGAYFSLSNSLRRLVLGTPPAANEDAASATDEVVVVGGVRFVLCTTRGVQFMIECETAADASLWFSALEEARQRVMATSPAPPATTMVDPMVLVRELAVDKHIRDAYDGVDADGNTLGTGMSGVVKQITRKSDGKRFAMKTILLPALTLKQLDNLKNEIGILKILDHPHICKLYEVYTEPRHCVRLVMELCEGGELFDRLHAKKRFSEDFVRRLVLRMTGVLRYLHENHVAHRDLKLENWLFRSTADDEDEIVLIDFGLSYKYVDETEHMRKRVGTSYYVAPEVLKGDYVGVQADVWSLGVIAYMLLGGCAPYDGKDDDEILHNVSLGRRPNYDAGAWRKISDEAKRFVQAMLTVDPARRLTAEQALQHQWLLQQQQPSSTSTEQQLDAAMYASLTRFAKYSALKRVALEVVAFSLSHAEIKSLTDVFRGMDSDHNGYVTFAELQRELRRSTNITDEEAHKLFEALDEDRSGRVHLNEFVAATMQTKYAMDERALRHAFELMDQDGTGFITVRNLKRLLGKHVDDSRALAMITLAEQQIKRRSRKTQGEEEEPVHEDHTLSFAEFLAFISSDGGE